MKLSKLITQLQEIKENPVLCPPGCEEPEVVLCDIFGDDESEFVETTVVMYNAESGKVEIY